MEMGDAWGFVGWRLMYIVEAVPAVILGVVCFFYLTDHPADAHWLTDKQRNWLINTLAQEERNKPLVVGVQPTKGQMIRKALCNRQVWLLAMVYFGITSGSNAMNFFMPTVLGIVPRHVRAGNRPDAERSDHRHPARRRRSGNDLVEPSLGPPARTSLACGRCSHARRNFHCRCGSTSHGSSLLVSSCWPWASTAPSTCSGPYRGKY